ncbi:MAG: hypothetical protein KDH20_02975 [Rhodocyclaceae bacterium]|nr:hypothetical protein [Rhodocyclaceae bacterium]
MALFTDDSVLVRTDEGEAAARQPRRVASNRARAALLLLDGQLAVGEMKRRFGESLEVEDALMELLRDGLAVDRDDAVTDLEEEMPAVEAMVAKDEPPTELPADPHVSLPPGFVLANRPAPTRPPDTELPDDVAPADLPPERFSSKDGRLEPELDIDEAITAAYADAHTEGLVREVKEPPKLTLLLDRLRFHLTRMFRGAIALVVAGVIGLILVILWNAPEWFRDGIEARMRTVMGPDVAIGSLGPAWSDGPALSLGAVTLGASEGAQRIARIEVKPDWYALWRKGRLAIGARVQGVEGRPTEVAELFNRADFTSVSLLRFVVEDLTVRFTEGHSMTLSGHGEVEYGALQRLVLHADRNGIEYRLPMPLSFPIELTGTANGWMPPFLKGLKVESLQFEGLLYDEGLQVVSLGGAMHGGRYGGNMDLNWSQDPVTLAGDFQLEGVRLERLMPALRDAGDLEGGMSGKVTLKSEAPVFAGLSDAGELVGEVEIDHGRFGGLDVGAIMRERGTGVVQGGATRFDSMRLDLRMNMKDRDVKASIRRFVAGNLQVGGGLLIKPDDGLSGRLTTTLAAGERRVSLPVVVSGTLGAPALRLAPEAVR